MIYIFVDTNIFLHCKFFIEIPWSELFGNPYKIVLAPVVLDELDKHKRNSNSKISLRAKKVLSRIEQILNEENGFSLQYIIKRPTLETFQSYQLDRQEQDDCILASIIEFKMENSREEIILISNDTGPRLRASSLGILSDKLPENLLIPCELTEEQKELKQLQQEVLKFRNAIPKLSLTFIDDSLILKHKLSPKIELEHLYIEDNYQKLLNEFPFLVYEKLEKNKTNLKKQLDLNTNLNSFMNLLANSDPLNFNSLSEEQVNRYNSKLKVFHDEYKTYLKEEYLIRNIKALTLPIDLKIQNNGNIPANDIDIWLHFPDGFILCDEDEFPKTPKIPKSPYKPKHRYDSGNFTSPMIFPRNFHDSGRSSLPDVNFNKPQIRQTNSYEVDFYLKNLKHFQSFSFHKLLVTYPSVEKIINFSIDYKIIANNVPEPVTGSISVRVEVE